MIRAEKYDVVLSGDVLDGMDLHEVKESFQKTFKLKSDQVESIFAGKKKTLKKNLDHNVAYHYKRVINNIGAEVNLLRVQSHQSAVPTLRVVEPSESLNDHSETLSLASREYHCPKCGLEQNKSQSCISCGIIFEKYDSPSASRQASEYQAPGHQGSKHQASMHSHLHAVPVSAPPTYDARTNHLRRKLTKQQKKSSTIHRYLGLMSLGCYTLGTIDFGLSLFNVVELTGVFWSPYLAWALGYGFQMLAGSNHR